MAHDRGIAAEDYDVLFIPGGLAPSELRTNKAAVEFVKEPAQTGRPVAALCHGPQMLITAGLASGRRLTSWGDRAGGGRQGREPRQQQERR